MAGINFHYGPDIFFSALVLHDTQGSSPIFPRQAPAPPRSPHPALRPEDFVFHQRGVARFVRPHRTAPAPAVECLVLDPWSGRWTVLDEGALALFDALATPVPLYEIRSNPWMDPHETEGLIDHLVSLNLVQVKDWPVLHPPVMPEPFTYPSFFSIHVTEDCNFRCNYCYADASAMGRKMTPETAQAVVERILESYGRHEITIEFHGGEPLLAMDAVSAAVEHAERLFKEMGRPPCTFLLQTNGSLVKSEHVDFFRRHRIAVGVSMDGPAPVHDRCRVFPGGRGTHRAVLRGIEKLQRGGIPGGILAVIENPGEYIDVCRYILSMGYTGFRLNHMVCQGRGGAATQTSAERSAAFAVGFLELADFLYDTHLGRPELFLDIWPLNIMIFHLLSSHRPFMCMRSPCGAGSHALGFDWRGGVYPCEQLTAFEALRMGSVFDGATLHEMVGSSSAAQAMRSRRVENIEKCRCCAFRNFCGGGCTAEAYALHGALNHEDAQCLFYRQVFEGLLWKLHDNPRLARLAGQFSRSLPGGDAQ